MSAPAAAPPRSATPLLLVEGLSVWYGGIAALKDVSLAVSPGELVAVIGPNGAGKSTLLKTIAGLIVPRAGRIEFGGSPIAGRAAERLVAAGLSLVPEGRHIFGSLSVAENLGLGATTRRDGKRAIFADLDRVLELFPILKARYRQRAGQLSGGEQQMLALGRALMAAPKLLLLDEPSLGLAPLIVRDLYEAVATLRASGMTVLVVEQNIHLALKSADRAYVLDTGRIVLEGPTGLLRSAPALERSYFGAAV
jgi:branched-chain amino acid transport system ATP-binding protein